MPSINPIVLPSFLRKTIKAYALKSEIRTLGCELNRIGRSRNWQLSGNKQQIRDVIDFIENQNEESWLWLAKHLRNKQEALTYQELINIAKKHPDITVNQLMAKTDCTIAQARKVIDELEFID